MSWQTVRVGARYDALAPDGSEIRLLAQVQAGSMVHCTLPAGAVTRAVRHRTVEEVWFCAAGRGQVWRSSPEADQEEIVDVDPGVSLNIPLGVRFQFRAIGDQPLVLVITTMPPWPGPDEAEAVDGTWKATL